MGNKLGRRKQVVDEKYTRPQGLYQHKDVDHKKLRKLILDSKLAPCYPGDDECGGNSELEECPICFLYYPSLNRSRCCMKGICTECFLQMKTPNSTLPTQCPFCKTLNYAVEYRGVKTKEEKGIEKIEEQLVIEAKIRMRQQEIHDEEERILKRKDVCSSSNISGPSEMEHCSIPAASIEGSEVVASVETCSAPTIQEPLLPRQNREDEFDLDLEDIMVMEAIWLSIQENGKFQTPGYNGEHAAGHPSEHVVPIAPPVGGAPSCSSSSPSPSGGLACAIAALAERQQTGRESSSSSSTYSGVPLLSSFHPFSHSAPSNRFSDMVVQGNEGYHPPQSEMNEDRREWADGVSLMDDVTSPGDRESYHQPISGPPIVPESFEEQMMLAMAVSLADSQSMTSNNAPAEEAWH
ncbi:unnamed protein product [Cuscuta europaea]|uniref:RING-type domain-containing protein n=1 Tax=Cuscuta europaea TaxID=41803 RepID=A0A9P0ZAH0_CUSEU|nr:unnamed protein product [Cuscuta europaea]